MLTANNLIIFRCGRPMENIQAMDITIKAEEAMIIANIYRKVGIQNKLTSYYVEDIINNDKECKIILGDKI